MSIILLTLFEILFILLFYKKEIFMINKYDYLSPNNYLPKELLTFLLRDYLTPLEVFGMMNLNSTFNFFIKNNVSLYCKKIVPLQCINQALKILDEMKDADPKTSPEKIEDVTQQIISFARKYDFKAALELASNLSDINLISLAYLNLVAIQAKRDPIGAKKTSDKIQIDNFKDEALSIIAQESALKGLIIEAYQALEEITDVKFKVEVDRKLSAILETKEELLGILKKIPKIEADSFRLEIVRRKLFSDYEFALKVAKEISSPKLKAFAFVKIAKFDPNKINKARKFAKGIEEPLIQISSLIDIANLNHDFEEAKNLILSLNGKTVEARRLLKLSTLIKFESKYNTAAAMKSLEILKNSEQLYFEKFGQHLGCIDNANIAVLEILAKKDYEKAKQMTNDIFFESVKELTLISLPICKFPPDSNEAIKNAILQSEPIDKIKGLLQIIQKIETLDL